MLYNYLVKTFCLPVWLRSVSLTDSNLYRICVDWNNCFTRTFKCCWMHSVRLLQDCHNTLPLFYLTDEKLSFWCMVQYSDNSAYKHRQTSNTISLLHWWQKPMLTSYKVFIKYAFWQTASKTGILFLVVFRTFYFYVLWPELHIHMCCHVA